MELVRLTDCRLFCYLLSSFNYTEKKKVDFQMYIKSLDCLSPLRLGRGRSIRGCRQG